MVDPDGGRFTYTHDAAGQLTSLVNPQGQTTATTFDAVGRILQRQLGNDAETNHAYDAAGRLTRLENLKSDGSGVNVFTYTYDSLNRRQTALEISGDRHTWTYDAAGQLTREQRGGTGEYDTSYTYDGMGNRLVQSDSGALTTSTFDAANQLATEVDSTGVTTYTYDADGNRTKKDAPSAITNYAWDADNRLTQAEPPAGAVDLRYNALGQRVEKETASETRRFIYDFKKLLQETDAANDTQRFYTATMDEYGDLVSEHEGESSSFHQYDALGSTDALLDDNETATDRYRYKAFGLQTHASGSSTSPFTFVGKQNYYRDSELDLYCLGGGNGELGGRAYDPTTGAFLSRDPARDDVNPYRYVGNDPVNAVDPSGNQQASRQPYKTVTGEHSGKRYKIWFYVDSNSDLPTLTVLFSSDRLETYEYVSPTRLSDSEIREIIASDLPGGSPDTSSGSATGGTGVGSLVSLIIDTAASHSANAPLASSGASAPGNDVGNEDKPFPGTSVTKDQFRDCQGVFGPFSKIAYDEAIQLQNQGYNVSFLFEDEPYSDAVLQFAMDHPHVWEKYVTLFGIHGIVMIENAARWGWRFDTDFQNTYPADLPGGTSYDSLTDRTLHIASSVRFRFDPAGMHRVVDQVEQLPKDAFCNPLLIPSFAKTGLMAFVDGTVEHYTPEKIARNLEEMLRKGKEFRQPSTLVEGQLQVGSFPRACGFPDAHSAFQHFGRITKKFGKSVRNEIFLGCAFAGISCVGKTDDLAQMGHNLDKARKQIDKNRKRAKNQKKGWFGWRGSCADSKPRAGGRLAPKSVTHTSPTGLKVTEVDGVPVRWEYKVGSKGKRGSGYRDVEVGAGNQRGHVKAVNEGAGVNAIDDGPLNIIEQTSKVNLSNVKRFELWRVKNAQGANVVVERLPSGYIRTRIPSKNIDVTYNPLSNNRFGKDWFLEGGVHD